MIIGEYDLRGILGKELTFELIEKVVLTFVKFLEKKGEKNRKILLAIDNNPNNLKVKNFLLKKFNFQFMGQLPTPIFYYQVIKFKTPGIMITASHLPRKYSGLKFLLKDGTAWKINNLKKII
ncbi:MAG: hypothetical protein KatS3mg095_0595 [Candidatus Parcubacteria bacterium]|nr:MAG: hypothetical protein KatS3mg095_0595 [Candidatus Parcubacteria bacterium]